MEGLGKAEASVWQERHGHRRQRQRHRRWRSGGGHDALDEAQKRGLKPMGRIVSWGIAGVDPKIMGRGRCPPRAWR